jgi:LysR family glycine cleavage system transcriptional activator
MRRRLPGIPMLAAFEAAARHRSFTAAASELALTQSAVGRQVAALQELLGVPLFRRTRHGIALTDAGEAYYRHVVRALDEMEREVLDLQGRRGRGGSIELGVVPTFAAQWLVPRLPRLAARNADLTVHLSSRTRPFLFEGSGLDAAIVAGSGAWPGTNATFLMPERVVPVCSPGLIAPATRVTPAQLARLPLLQQGTRPDAWRDWFASAGVTDVNALAGPRYELFSMSVQAAIAGLGVALVPEFLAEPERAAGRLVVPVQHAIPGRGYHLVTPADRPESPALAELRQWLLDECAGNGAEPLSRE